jgi:hypothetical protein
MEVYHEGEKIEFWLPVVPVWRPKWWDILWACRRIEWKVCTTKNEENESATYPSCTGLGCRRESSGAIFGNASVAKRVVRRNLPSPVN